MNEQKSLSLCMITKNDEKLLSACLREMEEVVDEIIIADVGSNDQTIEIARQAGANVYQMEWNNNYSEAKNVCLDQAKGRWVLFLQANETISVNQLKEVKQLLDNPNAEGYLLYIDHSSENGRISSPVQSLRLFRNRKEYRYQYRAFERIPDELLNNILDTDIQIVQKDGSSPAWELHSCILLLEEDLIEHPEDSYLHYIYGIELLNLQRYEESIAHFQKSRQNVNFGCLFAPHLYKCLSWSCIALQRYADALEVLEEGINAFSFYTDLLILRGELHKQLKQYGEAIKDLEKGLKIMEWPNSAVPGPEIDSSVTLQTLGEIHQQIFNYQQALACYQQAYALNKTNQELLYKIGELAQKTASTRVMENLLKEAAEQKNPEQLMLLMDVLFQQREYAKVLAYVEHLELFLGKGEQTEGIKISCYLMLGEAQEAELHFSEIDKQSPLYNYILMQRIESFWFYDQWIEAGYLLNEMEQTEDIAQNIKSLYKLLHRLLTGTESCCTALAQEEYDIVSSLHENFLWLEQEEKAKMLLPLLLMGQDEDRFINLAELWAGSNNLQIIQIIYQRISDKEKVIEFKQKILEQLLHNGHTETAREMMKLGDPQPLGPLEHILWSMSFIEKMMALIDKVQRKTKRTDAAVTLTLHIPYTPDKALWAFYRSLGIAGKNMNEITLEDSENEMTCSKIHEGIGSLYAKVQKTREALSAYMWALQWDPLNESVQEKIISIYNDNPSRFQAFNNYVLGLIHFKNQQFEQALAYFSEIAEDKVHYPAILAYIISSLWLMGKEPEAESRLDKQSKTMDVLSAFFQICKSYVLCRLGEIHRQYPYSELIMRERERIHILTVKECIL